MKQKKKRDSKRLNKLRLQRIDYKSMYSLQQRENKIVWFAYIITIFILIIWIIWMISLSL